MIRDLKGRAAYVFEGDNFDVDQIIGIQNIHLTQTEQLLGVMMQTFDSDFVRAVKPGDLIVGGKNFGYGHPHYPAMQMMRHLGVTGIVAESFAPTFWSMEIAGGFPAIACPGVLAHVERWDEIEVSWSASIIVNQSKGVRLPFMRMSNRDVAVLEAGGVVPYLKRILGA